jgi:type IV pilus assembly protein PilV
MLNASFSRRESMKRGAGSRAQGGAMLLEALIGILIFSMGILALVGLQAVSLKNTADAKYRSDAAFLANQIIGQMWTENPANLAAYAHNATTGAGTCVFSGGASTNVNVTAWLGASGTMGTVVDTLPGATAELQQISIAAGNVVTVTVCWRKPGEPAPHRYEAVAQING